MTDEDELRLKLMNAQLEETLARTERFRQEMRWEPYKAVGAIVGGVLVGIAAMAGVIIAVGHLTTPTPIVIQLQAPK